MESSGFIVKTPAKNDVIGKFEQYKFDFKDKAEIRYIIDLSSSNYFSLNYVDDFLNKIVILLWEPPVVMNHLYNESWHKKLAKVFTWCDSLVDNKKYFKLYYPVFHGCFFDMEKVDSFFDQKKLCVLVNAHKRSLHPQELYSERKRVIQFFEDLEAPDFDLYGYGWEKCNYKNYQGTVSCPRECIKNYRFCFCYENMRDIEGYITEKIFNCLMMGCIPIYWGASNISDYIPSSCFIDRRNFFDTQDVYNYIKNMDRDTYFQYLKDINQYLRSEQAGKFTIKNLLRCLLLGLQEV